MRSPLPFARFVVLVALTGPVLVATSCSGTSGNRHNGNQTTSTTIRPPSTGGTAAPTASCSTPTLAARAVVAAWIAGDRTAAAQCATPDAVSILFARPGRVAGWTFQGCYGPDPGVPICTFAYPGGIGRLTLQGTETAGWSVDQVQLATP